ncbi:iduronate 2-sulfatase [Papilio machaon]|uniref:iduronate 2-sulfatase n=1 Tax=Papilio machaon TaxID=76193 RepID=UPI001E6648F3|nr:iduronate 2-sulfatase [Papilio machaon]
MNYLSYSNFLLTYLIIVIMTNHLNTEDLGTKNIIFLYVDDLRHLHDKNVNLPNIKKIMENGITFKNAFCQQALCAPSRNSLLTGRRPDALRLYDFYSYWRHEVSNFTTLPQLLKANGYHTYSIGKIFHPGASSNYTDDYPYSWSEFPYHPPSEKYKDAAVCRDRITKQLHSNLVCPVKVNEQPDNTLPDLQSLKFAINILKENKYNPFFLAIGFHKPHIPLKFPSHYLEKIPKRNVKPPKYPKKPDNMPLVAWHPWRDVRKRDDIRQLNISYPMGIMPPKWTIRIRQSYYAAALYIDNLIGKLMRYVNNSNTIVVLTSDHGWSLGENGLWAKYSNFDVALRVPLIFNIPEISPNIIDTPVEQIDVFPTIADLTGIKGIPKCKNTRDKSRLCFEGRSLLPIMAGKIQNGGFAISQYPRPSVKPRKNSDSPRLKEIKIMGYSIRTQRYRYTEWISFNSTTFTRNWNKVYGSELYDNLFDPDESNNVCKEDRYRYIRKKLLKILRDQVENK